MDIKLIKANLSPDDIYAKYITGYSKNSNQNYHSVFRSEDNPSMHIYGEVDNWRERKFRDHGADKQGDAFQFIADLNNWDCKSQFNLVLNKIASDFPDKFPKSNTGAGFEISEEAKAIFNKNKNWKSTPYTEPTEAAVKFLQSRTIDPKILSKYEVKQLKLLTYTSAKNRTSKFDYEKSGHIAFELTVKKLKKIYVPKQKGIEKKYFLKTQDNTCIFGLEQLKRQKKRFEYILVLAGETDVLCAISNGFPAICFQTENYIPTVEQMRELFELAEHLLFCYDNDTPGQNSQKRITQKYDCPSMRMYEEVNDVCELFGNGKVSVPMEMGTIEMDAKPAFKKLINDTLRYYRERNFMHVYEQDGAYWKKRYFKNSPVPKIECVSNFVIRNKKLIVGEEQSFRLLSIENRTTKRTFAINTDILSSRDRFYQYLRKYGDFIFSGKGDDLIAVEKVAFRLSKEVREINKLGFDNASDRFIFPNLAINTEGKVSQFDENGCFDDAYVSENMRDMKNFHFSNQSNLTASDFFVQMSKLYSHEKTLPAFAFVFASIYFDIVTKYTKWFPLLNVWGRKGTGKSTMVRLWLNMFSNSYESISIHTATKTALLRKLEQAANMPLWIEEFNNTVSPNKVETLKNVYDLYGKATGLKTHDSSTKTSKVLTSAILSGQEIPANEALISRCLIIQLHKTEHSEEKRKTMANMMVEIQKGIGNVFLDLIQYRQVIGQYFQEYYLDLIKEISSELITLNIKAGDRIIYNYAAIYAPLMIAIEKGGLKIKSTKANQYLDKSDLFLSICEGINSQVKHEKNASEIQNFWDVVSILIHESQVRIEEHYDYRENIFYFNEVVYDQYNAYMRQTRGKQGLDKNTLRGYLEQEDYYIKGSGKETKKRYKSSNGKTSNRRSDVFKLRAIKDMGVIDFV